MIERYAGTFIVNRRPVVVELLDAPDGVMVDQRRQLYHEVDAIFICYAITDPTSFEKAMTKVVAYYFLIHSRPEQKLTSMQSGTPKYSNMHRPPYPSSLWA